VKARLTLRVQSAAAQRGTLELGPFRWPCAWGRGGIRTLKREGDGGTPRGVFKILSVYYRPDKFRRGPISLPIVPLTPCSGWCDAAGDRNYNREVRLPYRASAERMWRDDDLYDAVIVLDYNIKPRVHGAGSAIFLHVARPGYTPTEGCVAISKHDMRVLLTRLTPHTRLLVL
jgi:L,D-peptidoglycan transpeptidase YkuD (ErfK/YbiS/YcfS/YnhG family)